MYSDGYDDTPYKKPSTKKTKKKGTGRGVCQSTKKKHNLVNMVVRGPYRYREGGLYFLNIHKRCSDCNGYVDDSYLMNYDLDALIKDFETKYGLRLRDAPRLPEGAFRVK